jgi:sec-independent protein translocase protein TatA
VVALALLDIGPTEFLLIAGLFLLLFGADRIPDLARSIGKATAQFKGTARDFQEQLDRERGLDFRAGDAVPPEMKAQSEAAEDAELRRLQQAARALGIHAEGRSEEDLRAAIRAKLSHGKEP